MDRPLPPPDLLDLATTFRPAPDLADWIVDSFIADGADLENPDHAHLRFAEVRALWTTCPNSRAGRRIVGTAEPGEPRGTMGRWARARAKQQLTEWFGDLPTFLITIDASYAARCSDAEFCALIEHELYHCGQERDDYGAPKFRKDGSPAFTMRGHDVEEFVGVVRRYGADAAGVRDMIDAAKAKPEIARASIAEACGTCLLRAA